jgi:regulatory protein
MFLINKKTGLAEKISDDGKVAGKIDDRLADTAPEADSDDAHGSSRGKKPGKSFGRSSFGASRKPDSGLSSFGGGARKREAQDAQAAQEAREKAPGEYTRTSDTRKTDFDRKPGSGFSSFGGARKQEPIPGEYTRTSDVKKSGLGKKSGSGFGAGGRARKPEPLPGEYTRTSDTRKPKRAVKSPRQPFDENDTRAEPDRKTPAPRGTGGDGEAPKQSSKSYAVWLLARRDYSALNLRTKLLARGYTEEQTDEAMAFVIGHRFQDDVRFAEQRSRGAENRAGNLRIEMTLRQKGIDVDLAKAKVGELGPEEERVLVAAAKYRSQVARAGMTAELKVKIYRFLAYRGFSTKAVKVAIESLKAGASADIDDEKGFGD